MTASVPRVSYRRAVALLVVTVLVAAVGACGSSSGGGPAADPSSAVPATSTDPLASASAGAADAGDDPVPEPLHWSSCDDGFDCATLTVPVDYAVADGPSIQLGVTRRPATDRDHRIGSLVVNPGGPGGSGIDWVQGRDPRDTALNDRFDIVGWDPRGVGRSAPVDCGPTAEGFLSLDPSPNTPAEQAALEASAQRVAADCARQAGPVLDHLDTPTTVRDLEQLRRALGEDTLTYEGYSYGTAIGLGYAERYPGRVRALVLDGMDQPDWDLTDLLAAQAQAFEKAVAVMFDGCDRDPVCPVHDAGATYDRVARALETEPIADGSGGRFGPGELAVAATMSTYAPATAPQFLAGLARADRGDGSGLMRFVEVYRQETQNYGAYAGVSCVDGPHPVGAADYRAFARRLTAEFPRFGATLANEMLPCAFWAAPVSRTPHVVTAPGTPTILVVGTTGDPATPYASAVSVATSLTDAVLLTLEGQGHTSGDQSACVTSAVRRYLVDLVAPAADTRCHADS